MVTNVWAGVLLALMMCAPGWAILTIKDAWRRWEPLQRWCVAIGLSIAFYPTLFYLVRPLWPTIIIGYWKSLGLLLACVVLAGWRLRLHWREQLRFDEREWAAIALIALTLFTRFWVIRDHPYPAWTDSLHHTLLTQLTAQQGRLPLTLEPYAPIPLGQYHLGLYALSGTLQILTHLPAHTALLWMAQTLNGLCGLGVFLMLDRTAGRLGAVVGVAVAGLFSLQPNWYVNWGRFTQVSSQAIVLIAVMATWEAMTLWRTTTPKQEALWMTALAALLSGAVFLLHFRVAAFYLPLMAPVGGWELRLAYRRRQTRWFIAYGGLAVLLALLLISPALWEAVQIYLARAASSTSATSQVIENYYGMSWQNIPLLLASPWLLGIAGGALGVGAWRRHPLTLLVAGWVLALCLLGQAYTLNIPWLQVTNWGAILIMGYLPIALVIGVAAQLLVEWFSERARSFARPVIAAALLLAVVFSHVRVRDIEDYRYFFTPADMEAMLWINANTPPNAVFAVNTYFWFPRVPYGTDAGYWIPYFTGRPTTVGMMLNNFGPSAFQERIVALSHAVETLTTDPAALMTLCRAGVGYVYLGARGDFSGPGLDAAWLSRQPLLTLVYHRQGVNIFQISPTCVSGARRDAFGVETR